MAARWPARSSRWAHLHKDEVRRRARDYGLANHAKRDSTGICFVGERPFRQFLAEHVQCVAWPDRERTGRDRSEQHSGLPFYTLGQREGLGVGGRHDSQPWPWFVAAKDAARNALIVVQGRDHPWLLRQRTPGRRPALARRGTCRPRRRASGSTPAFATSSEPAPCQARSAPGGLVNVRFDGRTASACAGPVRGLLHGTMNAWAAA